MPAWLQILTMGGGIWLVLQAQVSGWFAKPKTIGEGKQASGAGELSLAQAQNEHQKNALKTADWERGRLEAALAKAEDTCAKCDAKRDTLIGIAADLADAVERLIDDNTPENREYARQKARIVRQAT